MSAHCKIGKIRFKNGAEMHLLPDARARQSKAAFADLDRTVQSIRRTYVDQLDGFTVIAWDANGKWNTFSHCGPGVISRNILPDFAAEALRRDVCEDDSRALIQRILRNE